MPPTLTFLTPLKLYIPILVISSVLKRCIREMMLASALLLFQTMWFSSWCKDDIFTDLRTLIHHNKFSALISWSIDWLIELVEDQNEFVTWAFTIALFPLWRFLCLLIDFMLAVQSPHRAVRAQRVSLVHNRVKQVGKPSPIQRFVTKHQSWPFLKQRKVRTGLFGLLTSQQA